MLACKTNAKADENLTSAQGPPGSKTQWPDHQTVSAPTDSWKIRESFESKEKVKKKMDL